MNQAFIVTGNGNYGWMNDLDAVALEVVDGSAIQSPQYSCSIPGCVTLQIFLTSRFLVSLSIREWPALLFRVFFSSSGYDTEYVTNTSKFEDIGTRKSRARA